MYVGTRWDPTPRQKKIANVKTQSINQLINQSWSAGTMKSLRASHWRCTDPRGATNQSINQNRSTNQYRSINQSTNQWKLTGSVTSPASASSPSEAAPDNGDMGDTGEGAPPDGAAVAGPLLVPGGYN